VSILEAIASWTDKRSIRKIGTRILIWIAITPIITELLGISLGLLAGGTATKAGLEYAISTGLIASVFRLINTKFKVQNMSLIEWLHKEKLYKTDWHHDESLLHIIFKTRNKNERTETGLDKDSI